MHQDSALLLMAANGTLQFYKTDSQCLTLNTSIYDIGILKNSTVREHKLWHSADIYNRVNSLSYALTNDTTYYYKLKVCDSGGKCAISKCSSFKTSSTAKCSYCDFVTRLKAPTGWNVSYDLDTDGVYEHLQGQVCGPNAGMKTNYTSGRKVNIKLLKSDGSSYIEFLNATLTKTALNDKVRTLSTSGDIIGDTSKVGMTSESRDKIINNLHPEVCRIKIPSSGTCTTLYYCNEAGTSSSCVDKTAAAGGAPINATSCIWNAPFCEFSTYKTNAAAGVDTPSSSGGGGGGGGGRATSMTYLVDDAQFISGYAKTLKVGDKIKVKISDSYHYIDNVTSAKVRINVTSELQQKTLFVGDENKFDVTEDGVYDLSVKLNSINSTGLTAELTVRSVQGKVTEEDAGATAGTGEVVSDETVTETETPQKSSWFIWILMIAIVAVIIRGIIYWIKSRKQM